MAGPVRNQLLVVIGLAALIAACSNSAAGTAAVVPGAIVSDTPSTVSSSVPTTVTATVTSTTVTSTTLAPPPTSAAPSSAPTPTTDLTGEVYGFVTAVNVANSQISLDKVDWFTGAAAQQACAEDGVEGAGSNWCTGYYYRNVNPMLRVVAVAPTATIRTLADGTHGVDSNLTAVADRVAKTNALNTYRLTVTDGLVTSLEEMFHP